MPLLKVDIQKKTFLTNKGDIYPVMSDVRLDVQPGEFVCIVGPSGCGKTTLLNIIAGLDGGYSGSVLYHGVAVQKPNQNRLVIFQELGLFPWLTVEQNVEFGLMIKGLPEQEKQDKADSYIEMVNLSKFRDAYIHQLSGGMKQRVALARALALEPEVLLMDEPFSALDAQTRDMLHDELQRIWVLTKKTIIFVTHNVREAVCLGDKVYVFSASPDATIKSMHAIDLPRPRQIESQGLIEQVRPIHDQLKAEITKYHEKQYRV